MLAEGTVATSTVVVSVVGFVAVAAAEQVRQLVGLVEAQGL